MLREGAHFGKQDVDEKARNISFQNRRGAGIVGQAE
jgi:hypothetical protein